MSCRVSLGLWSRYLKVPLQMKGKTYRVRPMQMHRVSQPRIVDEPHYGFGSLFYYERRTRRDAIISPERRWSTVGIDLGLELLDFHLVVENILARDGVYDSSVEVLDC